MPGLNIKLDTPLDSLNRPIFTSPKPPTFRAIYRLSTRPYALSITAGANSRTSAFTIHHQASGVRTVRLRHVWIALESVSVATIATLDLVNYTVLPTGGNVITPGFASPGTPVESTCLTLPTVGAENFTYMTTEFNLGVTGAAPAINPPQDLNWKDLVNFTGGYSPDPYANTPILLPGVAQTWGVVVDSSAASTIKLLGIIEFTEE